jgi:PIN domain nuclease of toxin-antitoxin system
LTAVLVDTQALLWWLTDDPAISSAARSEIALPDNEPLVSAATVWEIAIKRALGKLTAPEELLAAVRDGGFSWLPVLPEHAWAVGDLPRHHGDPFDRLLIAQARVEGLPVVTSDERFAEYGVTVRW